MGDPLGARTTARRVSHHAHLYRPVVSSDDWARNVARWHTLIELLAAYLDGVAVREHQRPSIGVDGGRSVGTGVYADFEERYDTYAAIIDDSS